MFSIGGIKYLFFGHITYKRGLIIVLYEHADRIGTVYESAPTQIRIHCPFCENRLTMYFRKTIGDWICNDCGLNIFIDVKDWGNVP